MTPSDLIEELLTKYPSLGLALYVLVIILIIAIVIFIIIYVISFFTGKPVPVFSRGEIDNAGDKTKSDPDKPKASVAVKKLPKNQKEFERVLNRVNQAALSRDQEEYRKQYDTLISLLSDAHLYNNLTSQKLLGAPSVQPYEVWLRADNMNSAIYKDVSELVDFVFHAISEITANNEKAGVRRASISLVSEDGFLHMTSSNSHPIARRLDKIFKIGISLDCGVAGVVAHTKKPSRIGDVSKNRYFKRFPTTPNYSSLLTVPIVIDEIVLGTLSIDNTRKNAYTDIDEKRLELFTHSIATAIITLMIEDKLIPLKQSDSKV